MANKIAFSPRATRLVASQESVEQGRGCQLAVGDQRLLLVKRDRLEQQVHTTLLRALIARVHQLVRQPWRDLDTLER